MKKFCLLILAFISTITFSQDIREIDYASFIPKDYTVQEKIYGDLNKDGLEDCVLIVKKIDPKNIVTNRFDEIVDRNRRGLIILFKQKNSYQLAAKNLQCFYSENEDGGVYYAPELFIEIKKGNLLINFAHGRYGGTTHTFRFQDATFKLIGYDSRDRNSAVTDFVTFDLTSINYLTRKKVFKEVISVNENGDEKLKETWENIKPQNLVDLSDIKDFEAL